MTSLLLNNPNHTVKQEFNHVRDLANECVSIEVLAHMYNNISSYCVLINPLTPENFYVFEWFSAYTRPIGLRDSIFGVTMESTAVLRH